ncbi:MAG: IreB family regulatory phosphoprotein [Oscillospiraceae bacterium]|nr:IreB family regulatory phosphoprotein [Oscillospiraceae bacterium]
MDQKPFNNTIKFTVPVDSNEEMKQILTEVYRSLTEKGYNPINQIVGFILSEDPTYITNHNNARSLICKLDRDELLQELVRHYLFHS